MNPTATPTGPGGSGTPGEPLRIGIGGPVGSGKTALVAALCRQLRDELSLAVLTNDIYTTEDADFLRRHAVLPDERIAAVQTGGCPHTAIRDDITANLDAIDDLIAGNEALDLILVESGGDNLTATFSSGLVDVQIFVVDVAGGDKVPRKGGPGVTFSDLLVINKTDLAPMVGADLDVMRRDAAKVRGDRPFVLISLTEDPTAALGAGLGARSSSACRCRGRRAMLSDVLIVASRPTARRASSASGGLAGRRTDADTVHLVSAAATPLGGDTIRVRVVVEAGARLLAAQRRGDDGDAGHGHHGVPRQLGTRGGRACSTSTRSRRSWPGTRGTSPRPGCPVRRTGRVRLRERVQIGRSHERQGFWSWLVARRRRRHAAAAAPRRTRRRLGRRRRTRHAAGLRQRIALSRNGISTHRARCSNSPRAAAWPPGRATGLADGRRR